MRAPQVGGLQLPQDVGVPESTAEVIRNRWSTLDEINHKLHMSGLPPIQEPDIQYEDVTAEQLLTTDTNRYTVLFTAQLRWYNYATRLVAEIRAARLEIENEMMDIAVEKKKHFRSMNSSRASKDQMSATEMKDLIMEDPRYRELRLEEQKYEQQYLKVSAWADGLDRSLKTVSRQIENRKIEGAGGSREGNMPGASRSAWESRQGRPVGDGR